LIDQPIQSINAPVKMPEDDNTSLKHPTQPKLGAFSSFNPTSYYASRRQQSFNLQAAADQLLSSSSSDDSTSSASSQQEHTAVQEPQNKKNRSKSGKKHGKNEEKKKKKERRKKRKHRKLSEEVEERQDKHPRPDGTGLFFIDTQGDDANVQFQGLYRGDIPSYNRHSPTKWRTHQQQEQKIEKEDLEKEEEEEEDKVSEEKADQATDKEESKEDYVIRKTREYNVSLREQPHNVTLWLEFAEFQEEAITTASGGRRRRQGLNQSNSNSSSNNSSSRVSLSMRKVIAEKKLAILEKALEIQQQRHGGGDLEDSEEEQEVLLLLALLKTAAVLVPERELNSRWLTALSHHPWSHTLWLAYLQFYQNRGSTDFSALDVASMYCRATETLTAQRQVKANINKNNKNNTIVVLEIGVVAVLLQGCSFLFQAGYNERAVAIVQAVLEFNFLSPHGWPEDALVMMFEEMWNDNNGSTCCIGEEGALGWGAWLDRQMNESTHKENVDTTAAAGSGNDKKVEKIHQPSPTQTSVWVDVMVHQPRGGEDDGDEEKEEEKKDRNREDEGRSDDGEEEEEEEEEEVLLKQLEEELDAKLQKATAKLTRETLHEWLTMEQQRSNGHWLPEHHTTTTTTNDDDDDHGEVNDGNRVTFQHIKHALVKFESSIARQQLLIGCLQLLNATIANNENTTDGVVSTLCMPSSCTISTALSATAHELYHLGISPLLGSSSSSSHNNSGRDWVSEALKVGEEVVWGDVASSSEWYWLLHQHQDKRAFVINMLTLLIEKADFKSDDDDASLLPILITLLYQAQHGSDGNAVNKTSLSAAAAIELCKAKLETQSNTSTSSSSSTTTMWLWHVYAQMESMSSGSWKMARKVYNTCLSSYSTASSASTLINLAPIVLGAATMEMKQSPVPEKDKNTSHKSKSSNIKFDGFSIPSLKLILEASDEALHAAVHPLAWYGRLANSKGEPSGELETTMQYRPRITKNIPSQYSLLDEGHIVATRRGYQSLLFFLLKNINNNNKDDDDKQPYSEYTMMTCIASYVSFELFIGILTHNLGSAIKAALSLYDSAISSSSSVASSSSSVASGLTEALCLCKCTLAVEAAACTPPLITPKVVTDLLSDAIMGHNNSRGSIPLLRLLAVHGVVGGGLKSGVRRVFYNMCSGNQASLAGWLMYAVFQAASAASYDSSSSRKAAVVAARSIIEKATSLASSSLGSSSPPLLWKCRLALESGESDRLWNDKHKKVLLMAVSACPGNKALWMQGMRVLCQEERREREEDVDEAQSWLEVMKSRDMKMRSDLLEAVFAMLEKEGGVE